MPLTLDELYKMDGEEVAAISVVKSSWKRAIKSTVNASKKSIIGYDDIEDSFKDYGKKWLAFRTIEEAKNYKSNLTNESCKDCSNCTFEVDCDDYHSWEIYGCKIHTDDDKIPHRKVPAKCRRRGDFIKAFYKATPEMSLDDNVEYWHTHDTGNELREFLGMTTEQYGQWGRGELSDEDVEKLIADTSDSKVYEDNHGLCRCGRCEAELLCDKGGDMPETCPKCRRKLDWSVYDTIDPQN